MCFSPSVSFAAGAVLSTTGVFALTKTTGRNQIPLAMIPLLFGIQQFCEGILWLTMNDKISGSWTYPTALVFLIFAQVIWPIWTPLAILSLESQPPRRKLLRALLISGTVLSIYHAWCLTAFPVAVDVCGKHIDYVRYLPQGPAPFVATIYLIVSIVPPFISSIKNIRILGVATLLSFAFAAYFYREYVISVWCLFAAVISTFVAYITLQWKKEVQPSAENAQASDAHPH